MSDNEGTNDGAETAPKTRGRKALPNLPCGHVARTGQGKLEAILMGDGSRVCRQCGKHYTMVWQEVAA